MAKRLFFAIRPSPEILRELEVRQQVFRESACLNVHAVACRWIESSAFHMTLHFLGDVDSERELRMREALAAMAWIPARIQRLDHLVAFPGKKRATAAGLGGLNGPLEELYIRMKPILLALGLTLEERRFYPHVTLVRFRNPVTLVEPLPVFSGLDWWVTHVTLFQSHLTPSGSRYEIVGEFPLAPAPLAC